MKHRGQTCLAVSANGERWLLLNAPPDLRSQIIATPALHPNSQRGSPICAVILTGAEIDQVAGLLSLREQTPFTLYATEATLAALSENPTFTALPEAIVSRQAITPGNAFACDGLIVEPFVVDGKVPLYAEGRAREQTEKSDTTIGVEIRSGGRRLLFVPNAASLDAALLPRLAQADVLLFDGTFYTDDEMIRSGTGLKTARRMGHMPILGGDGSLAALRDLRARRIFIHINNTNAILIEDSPERAIISEAGWTVAEDGMEITL